MSKDDLTTWLATGKAVLGALAIILALFKIDLPPEIINAILGIVGSGYLILQWFQGFFTNKK